MVSLLGKQWQVLAQPNPGAEVWIGEKTPRYSAGALGFMSQVSRCEVAATQKEQDHRLGLPTAVARNPSRVVRRCRLDCPTEMKSSESAGGRHEKCPAIAVIQSTHNRVHSTYPVDKASPRKSPARFNKGHVINGRYTTAVASVEISRTGVVKTWIIREFAESGPSNSITTGGDAPCRSVFRPLLGAFLKSPRQSFTGSSKFARIGTIESNTVDLCGA